MKLIDLAEKKLYLGWLVGNRDWGWGLVFVEFKDRFKPINTIFHNLPAPLLPSYVITPSEFHEWSFIFA